ncbi:MAG: hypothetical protein A2Y39_05140 [Candidatus Delongbacteria bacterium GWF2_40_14]|nr:MAG: hypothetical protein A2Y39_05140 [Candidatus Delongbacteria bacterium GWF2_40_14]
MSLKEEVIDSEKNIKSNSKICINRADTLWINITKGSMFRNYRFRLKNRLFEDLYTFNIATKLNMITENSIKIL